MKLLNLKKVNNTKVENWLFYNIPKLTKYQKESIQQNEIIQHAPFTFYEHRKCNSNILMRLTIIFIPIIWLLLVISLPINFIIFGKWGYNRLNWYMWWMNKCGL